MVGNALGNHREMHFFLFSNCCLNGEASGLGIFCVFLFLLRGSLGPFLICLMFGDSKIKEAISLCKHNFLEYSDNDTD